MNVHPGDLHDPVTECDEDDEVATEDEDELESDSVAEKFGAVFENAVPIVAQSVLPVSCKK